MVKELFPHYMK